MATTNSADQPRRPKQVINEACRNDNVSLVSASLHQWASRESSEEYQELLKSIVRLSIRRNALKVLEYILNNGGQPPAYSSLRLENPKKQTLETLLAHGWDMNARSRGSPPFLWEVLGDGELVSWCLENGAAVVPKPLDQVSEDERRSDDLYVCPPILEAAASRSSVGIFELLRSKGGQLGHRTLHFAAQAAVDSRNGSETQKEKQEELSDKARGESFEERIAMVVHLVDDLSLDPNALDQPEGWMLGDHWGTPLCYVVRNNPNWDCSEVVKFLLSRGADPWLVVKSSSWSAMDLAKRNSYHHFSDTVKSWKAHQVGYREPIQP